jgi:hypothetical protein
MPLLKKWQKMTNNLLLWLLVIAVTSLLFRNEVRKS